MKFRRMAIEAEGAEVVGYDKIRHNLAESSVRDRGLKDLGLVLDDIPLPYAQDHLGLTELRQLIATQSGSQVQTDHIMVTAGASAGLFILATSLLERGDHVVVTRPNYACNLETPFAIGCDIAYIDLAFEEKFELDVAKMRRLVTPKTRLVSLTCPNNPDGRMLSAAALDEVISIVEENDCWLLVDETYREMAHRDRLPVAATLSDRVVSISSMSKSYGVPGIRIGWIHCSDENLMHLFLCAKEQMSIHGSILDETVALHTLKSRSEWLDEVMPEILAGKELVRDWVASDERITWVEPDGGTTCFVRIDPELRVNYDFFYRHLLEKYGTYPGQGHWFDCPDNYMRIGFAWNPMDTLEAGLNSISRALDDLG